MARTKLKSGCCTATVVSMVDVTVHPALYAQDGAIVDGRLTDTMAGIRANAGGSNPWEAYCEKCGEAVDPWVLAGLPHPEKPVRW